LQAEFNKKHGITPQTVVRSLGTSLVEAYEADYVTVPVAADGEERYRPDEIARMILKMKKEMKQAATQLDFEKAAELRDRIKQMEEREIGLKNPLYARETQE
jgi:excinuclease ABC subunit B